MVCESMPALLITLEKRGAEYKANINDYDSPWKEALTDFFPQAIQMFSADVYKQIDWSVKPVFLDKEFQAFKIGTAKGRKYVDKLVCLKLRSGVDIMLLIHVEVQHYLKNQQAQITFAKRMFRYYAHISASYPDTQVFSLGVVLDGVGLGQKDAGSKVDINSIKVMGATGAEAILNENLRIKNNTANQQQLIFFYSQSIGGCQFEFTFPVINLSYWLNKEAEIERIATTNPFAVVIMSQLAAIKYKELADRFNPRVDLYRKLIKYGYSVRKTKLLLRLIDWIVKVPADLELKLYDKLVEISKENEMAYVSSMERIALERATEKVMAQSLKLGMEKGIEQGMEKGIKQGIEKGRGLGQSDIILIQLQHKFGDLSDSIVNKIKTASQNQLESWALNFIDAKTLDDVFK